MLIGILTSSESAQTKFIIIVAYITAAMLGISLHEVAHGYVAKLNGDDTAKMMGRLTLNPAKHFDLVGFLMFVIVGFGWAKPVPVNPNNFKNFKKGVITTSLAGVFANLIAGFVNFGLMAATVGIAEAVGVNSQFSEVVFKLFLYFFLYGFIINITLIAFNILPVYPLDGFNVLAMLTKPGNKVVEFFRRYGYFILLGLLLIGSIIPQLDIIGMYFAAFEKAIMRLFSAALGGII